MNAHKRHGYSYSDIADYALVHCNAGPRCRSARRRPIFTHLGMARHLARQATQKPLPGACCCELKRAARYHVAKAAEWRRELHGAM